MSQSHPTNCLSIKESIYATRPIKNLWLFNMPNMQSIINIYKWGKGNFTIYNISAHYKRNKYDTYQDTLKN